MRTYVLVLITILMMFGCKGAKTPDQDKPGSAVTTDSTAKVTAAGDAIQKLCFQNVHPYKNPPPGYEQAADYDQLKITIKGNKAYGIYNWLPYEKDSRKGSFVGTIEHNKITATYVYVQEEIYEGIEIEILLTNEYARVSSQELGTLDIAKVKCGEL
jgi:hypothetical protein